MQLEGNVDAINSRTVTTKYGDKPVYSMQVAGTQVDLGFKRPEFQQGEYVKLTIEKNRFGKYEIVKANGNGGTATMSSTTSTSSAPSTRRFPVASDSYEIGIIRQNALTNAVNYHANVVKDKADVEAIIATAYEFANFSSGKRERLMAEAEVNE